jgi:hypothetical protein
MTEVYLVYHIHWLDDDEDGKLISVYSSEANAQAAIERMRPMPGFRDWPDIITGLGDRENGFLIDVCRVDEDRWDEGYVTVIDP